MEYESLVVCMVPSSAISGHTRLGFYIRSVLPSQAGIFITTYYAEVDAFFLPKTEFFNYFRSDLYFFAFGCHWNLSFSLSP
jgi:hypothetical protein